MFEPDSFKSVAMRATITDNLSTRSSKGPLGQSQPDNYEGLKHGKIKVEGDKGVTIEGLQVC